MAIYFLQRADGLVKIGFSDDLPQRVNTLGSISKQSLRVIGAEAGGFNEERELHHQFADDAVGEEWHMPTKAVLARAAACRGLVVDGIHSRDLSFTQVDRYEGPVPVQGFLPFAPASAERVPA